MRKQHQKNCPNCDTTFVFSGDALDYSMLSPRRLARFRFNKNDNNKFEVPWRFTACVKCGLIWSTLHPEPIGWKINTTTERDNQNRKNNITCPRCKSEKIFPGQPLPIDWNVNSRQFKVFRPDGLSFWKLVKKIKILRQYLACNNCGLIYSFIDAQNLYRILYTKGTPKTKRWLAEQMRGADGV